MLNQYRTRVAVRVVSVAEDTLSVVVPGWRPGEEVCVPRPDGLEVRPGARLMAQADLAADHAGNLGLSSWEPASIRYPGDLDASACASDSTPFSKGERTVSDSPFDHKKAPVGLFNKYELAKADGTPLDPTARYFVLRYDKDMAARYALIAYAKTTANDQLAADLRDALRDTSAAFNGHMTAGAAKNVR